MSGLTQLGRRGARAKAQLADGQRLELALVLTHACNLACSYCYTGEKKRVRMPPALAERVLELAFDATLRVDGHLQLSFFGGEPLLEDGLLLALAERARARSHASGCPLLLQVTTNGTLLDTELVGRL
ncbi:MAG: radical SAM protein, partial [Deltaproteobacteria bacterium]|nr:radical SAM protein [Nannocystaceae bacterium]